MHSDSGDRAGAQCAFVLSHPSRFYSARVAPNTPLKEFPLLTWRDMVSTPLEERMFVEGNVFVKIVRKESGAALVGTTLAATREDGFPSTNIYLPLISFASRHEMYERGFYFYEKNILPLMAAGIAPTVATAISVKVDTLVCDTENAAVYVPALPKEQLQRVWIFDTTFDIAFLRSEHILSKTTLLYGFPECGVVGTHCPHALEKNMLTFHASTTVHIEYGAQSSVTTLRSLPTPLINYRPSESFALERTQCACGHPGFVVLSS